MRIDEQSPWFVQRWRDFGIVGAEHFLTERL
jgi:hypothetical protein